MTTQPPFDPFAMWRDFVTKFEDKSNSLANDAMKSEQFGQMFGPLAQLTAQIRQAHEKVIDGYFKALRLPSRDDIAALDERLQRIEDKIDLLMPMELREPVSTRPQRTRTPPAPSADTATPDKSREGKG